MSSRGCESENTLSYDVTVIGKLARPDGGYGGGITIKFLVV